MLKKYSWLVEAIDAMPSATIDYKQEWDAELFLIAGKMFAYVGVDNNGNEIITLKGDPENNRALIEMYDCVTEGYYANKIHWISIRLADPEVLPQSEITALLHKAYKLVFNKLPKKIQQQLDQK